VTVTVLGSQYSGTGLLKLPCSSTCCVDTGDMMVGDPQSWSVSLLYLPRFCVFVTVTKEVLYSPGMDPDR